MKMLHKRQAVCVPGASSPADVSDSDDEMGEYVGAVMSGLTSDKLESTSELVSESELASISELVSETELASESDMCMKLK